MVSVRDSPISSNKKNTILEVIEHNSKTSNKRKWEDREDEDGDHHEISFKNRPLSPSKILKISTATTRNYSDAAHDHFHLCKSPLPLDWQKNLDMKVQSGEVSFYNTNTQKTTWEDPRNKQCTEKLTTSSVDHMSLELELNLPCQSLRSSTNTSTQAHLADKDSWTLKHDNYFADSFSLDSNSTTTISATTAIGNSKIKSSSREISKSFHGLTRCSSWVSFEEDDNKEEMIAAVCMRCHMLVILCKSAPTCPNCKFMHPTDQSPVNCNPLLPCKGINN